MNLTASTKHQKSVYTIQLAHGTAIWSEAPTNGLTGRRMNERSVRPGRVPTRSAATWATAYAPHTHISSVWSSREAYTEPNHVFAGTVASTAEMTGTSRYAATLKKCITRRW